MAGCLLKTDLFDEAVAAGLIRELEARAERVVGIDVSPSVLAAAQSRYPELETHRADVRDLPFESATFAAVLSNSTLDHFDSPDDIERALRELHRVLVPGGLLLVTLDNAENPLVALRNALPYGFLSRLDLVVYRAGSTTGARGLQRLLAGAGFELERLGAVMHVPRLLVRGLRPLGEQRLQRTLRGGEQLGRLPTRFVTGQFVAALAQRP